MGRAAEPPALAQSGQVRQARWSSVLDVGLIVNLDRRQLF